MKKKFEIFDFLMLLLLNYFWLDWDPKVSAQWMCDQHCFKIGSEVIESVWDGVLEFGPPIDAPELSHAFRGRRHAKSGFWHPLSVWNGLCRSNMRRSLINAKEIFDEHERRTGKRHQASADCEYLLSIIESVDFTSKRWKRWFATQNGEGVGGKRGEERRMWISKHDVAEESDRNTCFISEPPQCINEEEFPSCRDEDLIVAYRRYYNAKTKTISGGMRYYYTDPPLWLEGNVKRRLK